MLKIHKAAVALDAKIQMRTGRKSGHSHAADNLSLRNPLAHAYKNARQMHVIRFISVDVLNFHQLPVFALPARVNHAAVADGLHRRARRRRVICAEVRAVQPQNWMKARIAEMRSDPRAKTQRRVQKSLLHRFARWCVISWNTLRIVKQNRAVRSAVVDVFSGQNFSVAEELS